MDQSNEEKNIQEMDIYSSDTFEESKIVEENEIFEDFLSSDQSDKINSDKNLTQSQEDEGVGEKVLTEDFQCQSIINDSSGQVDENDEEMHKGYLTNKSETSFILFGENCDRLINLNTNENCEENSCSSCKAEENQNETSISDYEITHTDDGQKNKYKTDNKENFIDKISEKDYSQEFNGPFRIILSDNSTECESCGCEVPVGNSGLILNSCMHLSCIRCLRDSIEKDHDAKVITCPVVFHPSSGLKYCHGKVQPIEIIHVLKIVYGDEVLLNSISQQDEYEKYNKLYPVKNSRGDAPDFDKIYTCAKDGCTGQFTRNKNKDIRTALCPECNSRNCIRCEAIHDGLTCFYYRSQLKKRKLTSLTPSNENLQETQNSEEEPPKKRGRPRKVEQIIEPPKLAEIPKRSEEVLKADMESWEIVWSELCDLYINMVENENNGFFYIVKSKIAETYNRIASFIRPPPPPKPETPAQINERLLKNVSKRKNFIPYKTFECPICMLDIDYGDGVLLQECYHAFCKRCLVECVKNSETAVVVCPFKNGEDECTSVIVERDIKNFCPEDVYNAYLQRSIDIGKCSIDNPQFCKNEDCKIWSEVEEGALKFICLFCNKTTCLKCRASHDGNTCKEYKRKMRRKIIENRKSEAGINRLIRRGEAMKCPGCDVLLIKNGGCDFFRCKCGTAICWATRGPRWGPKGYGDTSGGCKCRSAANGYRPCSPYCGNCH